MKIKRHRRKLAIMVPVASMGDIAFLLIIFFMLASNFVREAHVRFDPAQSPDIEQLERSQVSVTIDEEGEIWLQGEPCPLELLESGVRALIADAASKSVMLTVHRELTHDNFGDVFLRLSEAGAEIALIGTKSEE